MKNQTNEEIALRQKRLDAEKAYTLQLHNDKVKLLKLPEFQRVMADFLVKGNMFSSVMTGNSHTFYQSGKQDYAREMWASLAEADKVLAFELLKPKNEVHDG